MKKVAVILSGCGYLDGAEITETVSLLINLSQHQVDYNIYAPNQKINAVSHLQPETSLGERSLMDEAARITRGKVKDLQDLNPKNYDGLALPGGYGVAKNLSTWATKGPQSEVNPDISRALQTFQESSKPILAICISPAVVTKALSTQCQPHVTLGHDPEIAQAIESLGAEHVDCSVKDFVTDRESKIISTPAYMFDEASPADVFEGISKACREFLEMC